MILSPIFELELGRAIRRSSVARQRYWVAVIATAVSGLFILFGGGGEFLCMLIGWFACYLAVTDAGEMTHALFTEDRRNNILGLIFLTGISPAELFWGRLGGAALIALQKLLALVPMLSIPFLMGGVSQEVFWGIVAALPVLFLFVLSVSVLASVIGKDAASCKLWSLLLGGVICGVTPAYHFADRLFSGGPVSGTGLLVFSPAYGPYLLQTRFSMSLSSELWVNFAATLGWSAVFFSLSGWLLKRSLLERVQPHWMLRWQGLWRIIVHGGRSWRQRAAGWLEENPFLWLAAHDRQPVTFAWFMIGLIVAVWLALWCLWPKSWPGVPNFFLTALLLNCTVGALSGYTTAKRISEDRRDGVLELLLTTPLTTEQIVDGQLRASQFQFRALCRVTIGLNVLMMVGGLLTRTWTAGSLLVYAVCWAFLLAQAWWLGGVNSRLKAMWAGLNSGQPSYAIKTELTAIAMNSIQFVFNFRIFAGLFSKFPTGSAAEIAIVLLIAFVAAAILIAQAGEVPLRARLINEMRSISEEPVPEADDPRFKKWKLTTRLGESG